MTELPGSAAVGIEAVEWVPEDGAVSRGGAVSDGGAVPPGGAVPAGGKASQGGSNLIVRVTGRWRRRRPASGAQATLVIQADGRRHRFAALSDPPRLTGAAPGMWRLRFSVPGWLATYLGGRTWLQFGTVIVPLPAAASSAGGPGLAQAGGDRAAELARIPERTARPAGPVGGEVARLALEQDLLERRARSDRRVPAEPTSLAGFGSRVRSQSPSPHRLPVAESQAGILVQTLRRELDARAAGDAGLRSRLVDAEARLAARVLLDQQTAVMLGQLRAELEQLRQSREHERFRRAATERRAGELQQRVAELDEELSGQREQTRDAHAAIGELREALKRLQVPEPAPEPAEAPAPEPAEAPAPEPAEAPAAGPGPEPAEAPPAAPTDPAGPVELARLNDALARLRETFPPEAATAGEPADQAESGQGGARASLRPIFARLVSEDADAAGRLLLELLSLQTVAHSRPVSYDLVLGAERGCVCVSALDGPPVIWLQSAARPAEGVDFQVFGEPARIARLLTARGLKRRFGRRVAKVSGRRDRLGALEAVLDTPPDLRGLHRRGLRLDAVAALELVSAMVEPEWTVRERFTLAHRDRDRDREAGAAYLEVGDGRPMTVTREAPAGRIATTILCPADGLLPLLGGQPDPAARVEGDLGPLTALRGWIDRAQSGAQSG